MKGDGSQSRRRVGSFCVRRGRWTQKAGIHPVRADAVIPGGAVRSFEVMSTEFPRNAPSSFNPLLARILVVDDVTENVRLLIRILRRGGYTEVTGTTEPGSVLDRVKEIAPDLIVLDLHMPHMDGFAVIHEIRTLVDAIPKILVVTGHVEEKIRSRALAQGADDVVTKPFQIDELLRSVKLLLEPNASYSRGRRLPR